MVFAQKYTFQELMQQKLHREFEKENQTIFKRGSGKKILFS